MSRLMQARGLKLQTHLADMVLRLVAPHAGAWIETMFESEQSEPLKSRLMQARGLKPLIIMLNL